MRDSSFSDCTKHSYKKTFAVRSEHPYVAVFADRNIPIFRSANDCNRKQTGGKKCERSKMKETCAPLPPNTRRARWRGNRRGGAPRPGISRLFHLQAGRRGRNWSSPSAPARHEILIHAARLQVSRARGFKATRHPHFSDRRACKRQRYNERYVMLRGEGGGRSEKHGGSCFITSRRAFSSFGANVMRACDNDFKGTRCTIVITNTCITRGPLSADTSQNFRLIDPY